MAGGPENWGRATADKKSKKKGVPKASPATALGVYGMTVPRAVHGQEKKRVQAAPRHTGGLGGEKSIGACRLAISITRREKKREKKKREGGSRVRKPTGKPSAPEAPRIIPLQKKVSSKCLTIWEKK